MIILKFIFFINLIFDLTISSTQFKLNSKLEKNLEDTNYEYQLTKSTKTVYPNKSKQKNKKKRKNTKKNKRRNKKNNKTTSLTSTTITTVITTIYTTVEDTKTFSTTITTPSPRKLGLKNTFIWKLLVKLFEKFLKDHSPKIKFQSKTSEPYYLP